MMPSNEQVYQQYMYSYPHKTAYSAISPTHISDYKQILESAPITLYAHIPFCSSKCGYCNLFSVAGTKEALWQRYLEAIKEQAEEIVQHIKGNYESFIIGGGTPLILGAEQLTYLFEIAEKTLQMNLCSSFVCIETSPNETSEEKLAVLEEKHVNRLSMGVQSFREEELQVLKRFHSPGSTHAALKSVRDHPFETLNIDLIYGIPSQTKESLLYSLEAALLYDPEEIFLYPLYIRQNKKISGTQPQMLPL